MNKLSKTEHVTKWIPVKNISVIWAEAQRGFDERRAKDIEVNFDPDAFGMILVTLPNGQGIYHCVDGQTRVGAIRSMWGENEQVPCIIVNAKDPARAAHIFSLFNNGRNKPSMIERFLVGVAAGYEVEVAVYKLLTGLGYKVVADRGGDGVIRAVGTCVSIYKSMGGNTLNAALLVIQGTWGKTQASVDASLIRGYSLFLTQHGHEIKKQRLVDAIGKVPGGPTGLLADAANLREVQRGSLAVNVARELVDHYNRGLKKELRVSKDGI